MKKALTLLTVSAILCSGAMRAENSDKTLSERMLATFCDYARIDSRSCYPTDGSRTFTMTEGQVRMAERLRADAEKVALNNPLAGMTVNLSKDNYLYVTIPATKGVKAPVIGISCHLDVTPEVDFGTAEIRPIVDILKGHKIVRTDGTTLLGADDKCGCTIAMMLIEDLAASDGPRHGRLEFVFCPNEDVGLAAERIDTTLFNPEILFDIDGEVPYGITDENFTAKSFNILFKGNDVHPAEAKAHGLGDALAAAAEFISYIPDGMRPEHTEGREGYIHPFNISKKGNNVLVECRIRYFDKSDEDLFDSILKRAVMKAILNNPNVDHELVSYEMQYANVAYTLHPQARDMVMNASRATGVPVKFISSRGGTTASMFAAKGLKGGMCVFSGQHNAHSLREYADIIEMQDAYGLLMAIIGR